ncbi:Acetyltransferase (GNAT) domain-containing protein [Dyella sp. OK004]|uniref:GNAT family N-acetyltransferase n=1 Tax=Dyella sp. OK004 TaxID=1855292 RepID=UPI0008EA79DE|nr:GNAT family N-acetyltransferase [Dyella sp. OK004]SFR85307.1 Acetyltransferase (GNAT) domain-containing protein [Dyella sp. OK004]
MFPSALRMRLGRPEDARAIGALVRRVARRWVLPDQSPEAGAALLLRFSAKGIRQRLLEGQRFHLAFLGEVLVGVSAMRGDSHLVQFFVGTRYQGRGIARRLWQRTMQDAVRRADTRRFTLNASRCAVPVYLRLGFVLAGPEGHSPKGMVTTPMVLDLDAAPRPSRKRA